MKKLNYLFVLLMFSIFIPRVYAFTYDVETVVSSLDVEIGTETEIKVGIRDIQGTSSGIKSCSLNVEFESGILLNSQVKTFDNWELTTGKVYSFSANNNVLNNSDLLIIPVKVNGDGRVKLTNINCSDGDSSSKIDDVSVSFTVITDDNNSENVLDNSNCDLSNIILSEGKINFNSKITEYYVEVSSFDNLVIEPVLVNDNATYNVEKTKDKEIIINVMAPNGMSKEYTILVNEVSDSTVNDKVEQDGNNYTPIFIGIICILVLINIFRIVKNRKNNMAD